MNWWLSSPKTWPKEYYWHETYYSDHFRVLKPPCVGVFLAHTCIDRKLPIRDLTNTSMHRVRNGHLHMQWSACPFWPSQNLPSLSSLKPVSAIGILSQQGRPKICLQLSKLYKYEVQIYCATSSTYLIQWSLSQFKGKHPFIVRELLMETFYISQHIGHHTRKLKALHVHCHCAFVDFSFFAYEQ